MSICRAAAACILVLLCLDKAFAAPSAYVLDHEDQWTRTAHAADFLKEAGFSVQALPTDRSPAELKDADLIFLASFSCEHPDYGRYMQAYAADLGKWVAQGHVLVQMTQADQFEAKPPFLPAGLKATRGDADYPLARVLSPDHPLMAGMGRSTIQLDSTSTIWESFTSQSGFEVILASDEQGQRPALMDGAFGRGRIILSAMAFDKGSPRSTTTPDAFAMERSRFNEKFFMNLAGFVEAVKEGTVAAPNSTLAGADGIRFVPGSWTIAVLPDTQVYSRLYPGLFLMQTSWIVQNRKALDIRYVLQLGDITDNNVPFQWANARAAMKLLDDVVPYALVPGNHDYGPNGNANTRETYLNEYFPYRQMKRLEGFAGAMEEGKIDNTYHLFSVGRTKWIIIALEWAPRDETIEWADGILRKHANRRAILITHAYLNSNSLRYDWNDKAHPQTWNPHEYKTPGKVNDGEELWQKLVRKHRFDLVINGHVLNDGVGYLASRRDDGRACHQILVNYQMRHLGGEAYLRLLEFRPDGKTVQLKSYSPLYDRYLAGPEQQFTITLDPPLR